MRYFLVLIMALVVAPSLALAQQRQQAAPQKPAQAFQATGTIHSFNAQQINMVTAGDQKWVVKFDELTKVSVKGEGTEEMLRPGAIVRFYAKLSAKGVALEPIDEITTMSPRDNFTPMIELAPEGSEKKEEAGAGEKKEEAAGAEAPFDNLNLAEEEEPARGRKGRSRRGGVEIEEGERYFVVGILTTSRRGKLVVTAGEKLKIRAELAEDAKIDVDFTTHAIARPGDAIEVKGYFREEGEAMGRSVEITLAPPVEEEEGPKKRPSRSRRDRDEREKDEPQEEGAPGFGPR